MAISLNIYRKRNATIEYMGRSLSIKEWAKEFGIKPTTLWQRIYKYNIPIEKAMTSEKCTKDQRGRKITWGDKITKALTGQKKPSMCREKHHHWIKDRTKLLKYKDSEERRSPAYKFWRKEVCDRDGWKCRIDNDACGGRLEVHHILSFIKYPELKYELDNGICLCKRHHPRKRIYEIILINLFKKLVADTTASGLTIKL